ncbi:hypothetical protein LSUB1_G002324, partial [Lachnellula subtilissima]
MRKDPECLSRSSTNIPRFPISYGPKEKKHPRHAKNSPDTFRNLTSPCPKNVAQEARTHIFVHVVFPGQKKGPKINKKAVQTVKGWWKGRGIGRGEGRSASVAARFRNPSERRLSGDFLPKHE